VIKGIVIGFILAIAISVGLCFPLFFCWHGASRNGRSAYAV
jgi:hypothetical protein